MLSVVKPVALSCPVHWDVVFQHGTRAACRVCCCCKVQPAGKLSHFVSSACVDMGHMPTSPSLLPAELAAQHIQSQQPVLGHSSLSHCCLQSVTSAVGLLQSPTRSPVLCINAPLSAACRGYCLLSGCLRPSLAASARLSRTSLLMHLHQRWQRQQTQGVPQRHPMKSAQQHASPGVAPASARGELPPRKHRRVPV